MEKPIIREVELLKAELLKACPELGSRKLFIDFSISSYTYFVNFYNLPTELVSCGAEQQNNRLLFFLAFKGGDKYQLTQSVSALPREYQLRGKTASLEKLASYLAQFLAKVMAEVPPNYTHSKV